MLRNVAKIIKMHLFLLLTVWFIQCLLQKEVEAELDRLVGQEASVHTKMLALQRMGYRLSKEAWI